MNKSFLNYSTYRNNVAFISDTGIRFTYGQLQEYFQKLSFYLEERTLVFCFCENTAGSLVGYLSFLENKVVPVMLDAQKDAELIEKLLIAYCPAYLWLPISHYVPERGKILVSLLDYVLVKYKDSSFPINEELALLLTTSGSTGSPKLVRLSYQNILSNAESIAQYLDITVKERPVTSLPMYYSYGLSVINSHLLKGATILLTDKPVIQKEFWSFVRDESATSIAGVPYTYEMLKRLRIFQMDLPALTTFTQAGGKLNPLLAKECIEKAGQCGKRFIIMYGQTEATARMSYLPWERAYEKYDSIGIAIPGGCFGLQNEHGEEIKETEREGELTYTGPNVSLGYADCWEDLAKGDENKGTLRTGDLAKRDKDGFYYITGRMKRFIKIFGNRVNLDATEQLVKAVVPACACIGVDDKLTVFIAERGREEEIKTFLVQKTGLNERVFAVKVIDTIPKNPAGKIQYAELMKLL